MLREAGESQLLSVAADGLAVDAQDVAEELESELARAERLLASLPSRQSQVIRLRYLEQLDYSAIARRMNSTTLAARSLASKGLAKIRQIA